MGEEKSSRAASGWSWKGVVATLLALVVAAVCIRLGFWQLDRQAERDALNRALAVALEQPPVSLAGDSLRAVMADPAAYVHRRATLTGIAIPEDELVLRGRAYGGQPGVNLVTPMLLLPDSVVVMLNRGWAASPDAATLDPRPFAEPGPRSVLGLLQPLRSGGDPREAVVEVAGAHVRTVQRLSHDAASASGDFPVLPLLVQQIPAEADSSARLARLPVPDLDDGPHLGYAIQWFSFAAIALGGLAVMLRLSRRKSS